MNKYSILFLGCLVIICLITYKFHTTINTLDKNNKEIIAILNDSINALQKTEKYKIKIDSLYIVKDSINKNYETEFANIRN